MPIAGGNLHGLAPVEELQADVNVLDRALLPIAAYAVDRQRAEEALCHEQHG